MKIQVTTIKKEANVQIIELNAAFISKSIRAMLVTEACISELKNYCGQLSDANTKALTEVVKPFLDALCDAFEDDEE